MTKDNLDGNWGNLAFKKLQSMQRTLGGSYIPSLLSVILQNQ